MDVFDLVAKIRLDSSEYEKGLGKTKKSMGEYKSDVMKLAQEYKKQGMSMSDAMKKAYAEIDKSQYETAEESERSSKKFIGNWSNASEKLGKIASGVGKGLATVAKVGAAAVSAGVAGVTALTKMGVEGYAQYEQLVGGVETLFKSSQDTVMRYAENAYKTSGMSANAYMETVTSFSASLIQSLDGDTAKAAKVADMAITDMSDNANKMGTDIAMIQNAYNGFAKGNFTMLDNLKLGYGGTQEEMKRLLKDAEALSGVKYDISSFADVAEAIHVIQEEMGVAGTTAREAASTIEGSLAMMKGAWENLVVGMADENANMDLLINNFVESTATAAQNLIPRIEQTLAGIGQLITAMAPIIAEALPVLVESLLPTIITAGISLIAALASALVTALPAVKTALLEGLTIILTDVFGMSKDQATAFSEGVNSAFTAVKDGFLTLVEQAQTAGTWLNEIWTGLQATGQAFSDFLVALWNALSAAFAWCVEQINTEGTYLNTIWQNIQTFISAAVTVIQNVIKLFTAILTGDWSAAWSAVQTITQTVSGAITSIVTNIVTWITGFLGTMVSTGFDLINSLSEGIQNKFAEIMTSVGGWVTDNIINPIADMGTELYNAGVNLLNQFWDGLASVWGSIVSWWDGLTLSDKTANVNVNRNGGGYATGLNYVPYDEFPALLHRGEAVLTAAEATAWRNGTLGSATPAMASGVVINQYIQSVPQTPADLASATEAYFEQARWML